MTLLASSALNGPSALEGPGPTAASSSSSSSPSSSSLPRFVLRKRAVSPSSSSFSSSSEEEQPVKPLPAVTSAFLSGLFADVLAQESSLEETGEEPALKKSRLSLHRSMSRCAQSFKNLQGLQGGSTDDSVSPTGVADAHFLSFLGDPRAHSGVPLIPELRKLHHHGRSPSSTLAPQQQQRCDSLHFQLCCVSDEGGDSGCGLDKQDSSWNSSDSSPITLHKLFQAGQLAFPHLPATISNSSCGNNTTNSLHAPSYSLLTRNLSDLQSSLRETLNLQSDLEPAYGWFVVVDPDSDNARDSAPSKLHKSMVGSSESTSAGLAFVAPTAPQHTPAVDDHDDEVMWAKAADTVDDVLGDFF